MVGGSKDGSTLQAKICVTCQRDKVNDIWTLRTTGGLSLGRFSRNGKPISQSRHQWYWYSFVSLSFPVTARPRRASSLPSIASAFRTAPCVGTNKIVCQYDLRNKKVLNVSFNDR